MPLPKVKSPKKCPRKGCKGYLEVDADGDIYCPKCRWFPGEPLRK